ncbi:MarR family winged helix-turn-helix transcriptional regulator [Rhizorhapis sp. SPR117]|uniref:MarR family winged helix-turn-helix transcriptional regulator n=1 Tax=Rhizorhapis sp. SPR117 TaxID=2912611 RepID=UPI001F00D2D3|nr:MarR family transcriptional regulator [Rhizorhapis sp. SPR117]
MAVPEPNVAMRISYLARTLRTRFDSKTRDIGLTRAQWRTIVSVRMEPGATQHRIAELLQVGAVTAGRSIDRLTEAGWLERRSDPADRRAYRVYVAEKATPVLERLGVIAEEEGWIAFAGFDAHEMELLRNMLDRVARNLDHCDNLIDDTSS